MHNVVIGNAGLSPWFIAAQYNMSIRADYMNTREFCNVFWNWFVGPGVPFAAIFVGAAHPPSEWPRTVAAQSALATNIWMSLGEHDEDGTAFFMGYDPGGKPGWHAFCQVCREGKLLDMSTNLVYDMGSPEIPNWSTGVEQYRLRITWPFWIVPDSLHPHPLTVMELFWPSVPGYSKRKPWSQPWNQK